ncbi:class I SAM-dependent DNA methyltransferase [Pseudonocardia spinosispora]|uniref:class I SAM-dependent DNA methyltransferase n=1 Tax=Pseudonocardia spinosispora TaxID=103441 RepID=UPI0003F790A5|nr:class I SAM-dependent methyltransferase [Pseudonocardia spinosispora]
MRESRVGQGAAFDAIGAAYDDAFPDKEGQLAAGAWLVDSLPAGSRVLDLGCGTGVPTARQLTDAGLDVLGIDLSARMVELARQRVPSATFRLLDIADLRPGAESFAGVAAFFSLLMLPRAEIPEALATVRQVLGAGGLLTLSMVEADVDYQPIPFLGQTIRVSGYRFDDLCAIVAAAGFDIVGTDTRTYAPAVGGAPPEQQHFLRCQRSG